MQEKTVKYASAKNLHGYRMEKSGGEGRRIN